MFAHIDNDDDGNWSKQEFLRNISFNRGKPNLLAIRPGGKGDIGESHVAWSLHRGIPEIPSPIFYGDRVYLISDGGILSAVDASDGSVLYRRRLGTAGHYRSSPVIANDHLYVISEAGVMSVVRTGHQFELVHQCDFHQRVAATPGIDTRTIYVRTTGKLYAFRRN
jgi:outer membrane protein assembly factor BamB